VPMFAEVSALTSITCDGVIVLLLITYQSWTFDLWCY